MSRRFGVHPVVSGQQLPTRLPITGTLVVGLVLDRLQAPGWMWGAVAAVALLLWILIIYCRRNEIQVRLKALGGEQS